MKENTYFAVIVNSFQLNQNNTNKETRFFHDENIGHKLYHIQVINVAIFNFCRVACTFQLGD